MKRLEPAHRSAARRGKYLEKYPSPDLRRRMSRHKSGPCRRRGGTFTRAADEGKRAGSRYAAKNGRSCELRDGEDAAAQPISGHRLPVVSPSGAKRAHQRQTFCFRLKAND
ncbi:hypothetical protein AAFF_G00231490 [Aldrovandia affinis]|uniref:Uncharacterized protein n=1 Tax=Aldrovandia affinis TaxID=143900 RepID=A0AAD7W4I8_9TELE|nr:hypothetical protein AAFF_G00231490 [Aldrovandia affinis]